MELCVTKPQWAAGLLAAGLVIAGISYVQLSEPDRDSATPAASSATVGALPDTVTYASHIAPIVHRSCAACHRPGEAGPFPLLRYEDAAPRSGLIAQVTGDRIMPPWPADPSYRSFLGQNVLSDREIALIRRWAEQGAPRGDSTVEPRPPEFPRGSTLGTPDLVVRMPGPIRIPGNSTDVFAVVKLPFELPADTFLKAIEFVPGNRRLVHHMNASLITYPDGAKSDLAAGAWHVIEGTHEGHLERLRLENDDGTFAPIAIGVNNYLPGANATMYPEGIGGHRLARKNVLLMNMVHYGPSTVADTDTSYFNLFFAKQPPERPVYTLLMGTLGVSPVLPDLVIAPNAVERVYTQVTLPDDVTLLTINPHMHLLGRSFKAYAVTPVGDTIPLIHIPEWDFRWQYFYTFERMIVLRRGTKIIAEGVYDNTAGNPNNPFSPPREVRDRNGSMRTTDEMFQCILTIMKYRPGDEQRSLAPGAAP